MRPTGEGDDVFRVRVSLMYFQIMSENISHVLDVPILGMIMQDDVLRRARDELYDMKEHLKALDHFPFCIPIERYLALSQY